jgi:hypothetical protein
MTAGGGVRPWSRCEKSFFILPSRPSEANAEISFPQAMALKLWAAISQARLWQHQGQHTPARELLAPSSG